MTRKGGIRIWVKSWLRRLYRSCKRHILSKRAASSCWHLPACSFSLVIVRLPLEEVWCGIVHVKRVISMIHDQGESDSIRSSKTILRTSHSSVWTNSCLHPGPGWRYTPTIVVWGKSVSVSGSISSTVLPDWRVLQAGKVYSKIYSEVYRKSELYYVKVTPS